MVSLSLIEPPGWMIAVSAPSAEIMSRMSARAPCPKDMTRIIAATPIMMPRVVSKERDLWSVSPCRAVRVVCFRFISFHECLVGHATVLYPKVALDASIPHEQYALSVLGRCGLVGNEDDGVTELVMESLEGLHDSLP